MRVATAWYGSAARSWAGCFAVKSGSGMRTRRNRVGCSNGTMRSCGIPNASRMGGAQARARPPRAAWEVKRDPDRRIYVFQEPRLGQGFEQEVAVAAKEPTHVHNLFVQRQERRPVKFGAAGVISLDNPGDAVGLVAFKIGLVRRIGLVRVAPEVPPVEVRDNDRVLDDVD